MNACMRGHGHVAPALRAHDPSIVGWKTSWSVDRAGRRAEGFLVEEAQVAEGAQGRDQVPPESLGKLPRHDVQARSGRTQDGERSKAGLVGCHGQ